MGIAILLLLRQTTKKNNTIMKTMKRFLKMALPGIAVLLMSLQVSAQRKKVTVVNIDTRGSSLDMVQVGIMLRNELERMDTFDVTDRYEFEEKTKAANIDVANAFSKEKTIAIGELLGSDYVLGGNIDAYNESIIISLRLVNVKNRSVELSAVKEFGNYPKEMQNMLTITLKELFGRGYDKLLYAQLSKKYDYENSVNTPNVKQLNLSGPRMGYAGMVGKDADILRAKRIDGGFEMSPFMFQLGYQFEKQYLNGGSWQALFEFIPMITGMDQNSFVPSFSIINGLRNNVGGWEFGMGATFSLQKEAEVFDYNGKAVLVDEWASKTTLTTRPTDTRLQFDSRGTARFFTAIVIGAGKSFRSGNLNIPVNVWIMPQRDAFRFGLSFGFNSRK